ncbi:hypothetical protein H310_05548 [Aphanomyces invadans]|uniref:WRKY19-like zinc finger domain-containing protein n=1 Tax=Aphanomyces invadans TaxID=157072 RepID=A0A024UA83_9STRA|nr:hypothetical protein H310_05548 [Aphanomyces invadans]ETW03125.1 hypothetical protein H310_05548 [Aphanomyces invadans]|eukprot:XP_008868509.1 hypothetical protein H310_05548 [Aphanomyces invadans]
MSDLTFKEKIGKSFSFLSVLGKKNKAQQHPSAETYANPVKVEPTRHIESHPFPQYHHDPYASQGYPQQHHQQMPPPLPPMHPYMSTAHERTNVDDLLCTPTPENRFPTPITTFPTPTPDPRFPTPTPDIKYPSPFDFARDRPTPVEKMEDLQQLQEALLPSPFDYLRNQQQLHYPYLQNSNHTSFHHPPQHLPFHDTSAQPAYRSLKDKQVADEINTLCRDLVTHGLQTKEMATASRRSAGPSVDSTVIKPEPAHQLHDYGNIVESGYTSGGGRSYDSDSSSCDIKRETTGSQNKQYRRKNCSIEGCSNLSRSKGLCKAHGGGRRCSVQGCTRASQSSSLCIAHGGGKRCTVEGCTKAAQSRGMCKAHGGGVRCRVEGCTKSSQGDGYCRSHGGGRRCGHASGCMKWAQRNGMCMTHSEGKYGNSYRGRLQRQTGDAMSDTDMMDD